MSAILLDTHALLWLVMGNARLGRQARRLVDRAVRDECLFCSAMTHLEIAQLHACQRIHLESGPAPFLAHTQALGMRPWPVTADIALRASEVAPDPKDLFDRIILATALTANATLLTADSVLLQWKGRLKRHDAEK